MTDTPDLKSLLAQKADAFEEKLPEPFPARLVGSGVKETPPELRLKHDMPEYQGVILWEPLTWKTKTGNPMPDYFPLSSAKNGKQFLILTGFRSVEGVFIEALDELDAYHGRPFSVQRTPIKVGRQQREIGSYMRPLALLTEEEVAQAVEAYQSRQTKPQAAAPTMGIIDDETALTQLIGEGIEAADVKALKTAIRRRLTADPQLKADAALAGRVIDGSLVDVALREGRIEQVQGVYVLAAAVAVA